MAVAVLSPMWGSNGGTGVTIIDAWAAEAIKNAQAIKTEPVRRGRWLTEYGDHIRAGLRPTFICCSECGMVSTVKWNYCPICGARMEGRDEVD